MMSDRSRLFRSTGSGLFVAACLILALQAIASRSLNIKERDIPIPGLHQVPMEMGKWRANSEQSLDSAVAEYLKPDEYILRDYGDQAGDPPINVFVAYFKSLQNTYGPHSPSVCLPGSGWLVSSSEIKSVTVPGRSRGIPVNKYVLEKTGDRILVLYWYQNDRNVWTEQFQAKLRLLPDLIRYRRSDVSLVRLITPLRAASAEPGFANCEDFTRQVFPALAKSFATAH